MSVSRGPDVDHMKESWPWVRPLGVWPTGWAGERLRGNRRCPAGYLGLNNRNRGLTHPLPRCTLPAKQRRFNARSNVFLATSLY